MRSIPALSRFFFGCEATFLEINPLFILPGNCWVAGDCKLAIDDNALTRQDAVKAIVEQRPSIYRDEAFKLDHGFDYVELDQDGEIGLLTTGAGLSMMLVDEMRVAGHRPFNFCDVRSGLLRGSPERLIQVLRRFVPAKKMSVVLVNIFAGVTDLGEFAKLLVEALDAVPELKVPVVARLVGNNFEVGRLLIERSGRKIDVEINLDRAVAMTLSYAKAAHAQ